MSDRNGRDANRQALRNFAENPDGSALIEFGLLALPFFCVLFATLQTALIFFASQVLETGVSDAARLIRTGQAQEQSMSQAQFKQAVCNKVFELLDCDGNLKIDVRRLDDFNEAMVPKPIDENGNFQDDNFTYQPGIGGDIILVRAFYEWPTVLPEIGVSPSNLANGKYLLAAAATFRNEPF